MKEKIEKIANVAFERLLKVYESKTDGGIIFPKYTHGQNRGKLRVSEQEMRFAFVEEMRRECPNWFYSVETPTDKKYLFKGEPCIVPEEEEGGQSAQFDLTIYEDSKGDKVLAHIEFKAHNPDVHEMKKDFLKLAEDKTVDTGIERVFIHIFESFKETTFDNIKNKKLSNCNTDNVLYLCYSIEEYKGNHKIEFKRG